MANSIIATGRPGVSLRHLDASFSEGLHQLLQKNRLHLTAHGDYRDHVSLSLDALRLELSTANNMRFGIFAGDELVGRIDLVPVDPPRYGLGYWLAEEVTGLGYAYAAVAALIDHARKNLSASDIFAGVTHGNTASEAVLARNGFTALERFDSYTRFHRSLGGYSSIQDTPLV